MNPDEFVSALVTTVFDAAVRDVVEGLEARPPGRRPHARSVAMHEWFVRLPERDQRFVVEAVRDASHSALFGMLCVLDGVRQIDDPPHVELVLTATDEQGSQTLNDGEDLHDILNAHVHPPSEPWASE
ncbi:MAG: hypothetical protein IR158_12625 [Cellulomonas sp.]|uniref:hypothetical protein n=1 Tax=Cellulomonas sp. TaxID=40001 RepID=UPI0019DAC652|nr:hypothetical protein [Cellulomonas sp.]MBF0688594.1 hypothetical protein [Cellulomonas sp.]